MDGGRFDSLTRSMAGGVSRRRALGVLNEKRRTLGDSLVLALVQPMGLAPRSEPTPSAAPGPWHVARSRPSCQEQ